MQKIVPTLHRRIAVSTVSQIISQLFVAILGVVALKIMTLALGIENFGIYATILAFVSTFSLLTDLGLNGITARESAKYPEQADSIISYNMGLRIFLCSIMIPAIFGLGFLFYPDATHELRIGILLMSLYLFFDAIRTVSLAYFVSKVRNEVTAIINAVQQSLQLVLIILAAVLHWPIFGYIGIFLFTCSVVAVMALFYARRYVEIRPRVNIQKWKRIIVISGSLGALQLINMMYLKADSIILSILKGTDEVGVYSIAYSLILAFLTLPSFLMTALLPSMATASHNALKLLIDKALQYMAIFACLLAVSGFIVRYDIIPVVSGHAFLGAANPFAILALASAFTYLSSVFGFAGVAVNKHHKMVYVAAATLVLNIVLNFILVPRYSISGAAFATAISELIALVFTALLFQKQTGITTKILSPLLKPALAACIVLIIAQSLRPLWSSNVHFVNLTVSGLLIVVVYTSCLVLLRGLPAEVSNFLRDKLARR